MMRENHIGMLRSLRSDGQSVQLAKVFLSDHLIKSYLNCKKDWLELAATLAEIDPGQMHAGGDGEM